MQHYTSAEVAAKVLHRSAMRELVAECHELIAEELRIKSLVIELQSEYNSLSVFTGSLGGSRGKMYNGLLEKDLATADEKTKEAKLLVEDPKLITTAGNDLDRMQGRIGAGRLELQTIREGMLRNLENVRGENQHYREKVST